MNIREYRLNKIKSDKSVFIKRYKRLHQAWEAAFRHLLKSLGRKL